MPLVVGGVFFSIWDKHWLQLEWEGTLADQQVATKELLPIVAACTIWGSVWEIKVILVMCDNMTVVQMVTALSSTERLEEEEAKGC